MIPEASATPFSAFAERRMLVLALAAGLCWASAIALIFGAQLGGEQDLLAPLRVIFYLLVIAAALLTFVPMQRVMRAPGLALEGVCGTLLLLYSLAFMPPPTAPIFFLPDLPVYVVFLGALLATVAAFALPLVHVVSKRIYRRRARQYDLRRAWRQAHEIGMLFAASGALAGLRILTPLAVLLVALILIVAETLFLAYVETPT